MRPHERGRAAERLVSRFLVERGLEPLEGNWRRRLGEIDLVMREIASGTIVFVEVRYRARADLGGGLESVDHRKRARLRRAALAWLQHHDGLDAPARIDVVAVGPAPACGGSPTMVPSSAPPTARDGRVVAYRDGHLVEWVVDAIEDDG